MKGINSFLLVESFNLAVHIILLHSMTYGEQTLCQRGFALIRTIFSISNEIPIDLNRISQQFSQHQRTLLFYTGERRIPFILRSLCVGPTDRHLYQMAMPLIATFRISAIALENNHLGLLDKNAKTLLERIQRTLEYVDHDFIFCSLIELLPELFACTTQYESQKDGLFTGIRDTLLHLFSTDIKLITPNTFQNPTRIWRLIYLIQSIVRKTPAAVTFFAANLLYFGMELQQLYAKCMANPVMRDNRHGFVPKKQTP